MRKTKIQREQRKLLSSIEVIDSPNEKNVEILLLPKSLMENKYIMKREAQFFGLICKRMGVMLTHSDGRYVGEVKDTGDYFMMRHKVSADNAITD